jgi:hypothetical protein
MEIHTLSAKRTKLTEQPHSPLIFIFGHRKSGTTMLSHLLDGHPQLAVFPIDLTILYSYFPEFVRAHNDPQQRRDRLRDVLFVPLRERLADCDQLHNIDVDTLERYFFDSLTNGDLGDLRVLISRLMATFQTVSGQTVGRAHLGVFKETSAEIYAAEIAEWFPDGRFIHLIRDPRDNFAALNAGVERYYSRLGEDRNRTLASLLHRVRIGFQMALQNQTAFGTEKYHLVRLEDLASAPERAMRAIANFLGIGFDASLLAPTQLGRPSRGNNFDGDAMFSISSRNIGRWRERITAEDAQIIEFHLANEMAAFGYELQFEPGERARAAAEFYKWQNYTYFYSDRFAKGVNL